MPPLTLVSPPNNPPRTHATSITNHPTSTLHFDKNAARLPTSPMPPILKRHIDMLTHGAISPLDGQPFRRRRTDQPVTTQRGFTIIEMMLVIAVVAILCAVSFPSFSNVVANSKSRTASNTLMTGLNLARSTAISRGADVVMCPSHDGESCDVTLWWQSGWIVFQDRNHDNKRQTGEPLLTVTQVQPGIAIATTQGREHVTYRSEGTSGGTNLTFTLCDHRGPKFASTVVVSNPGRPRIGKPTSDQAAAACAGL